MGFHGRCACGAVELRVDAIAPVGTRQCWCRQCQQIAAGGPTHNAIFPTDAVEVSGDIGWHSYVAESGNTLSQGFCRSCGSPVMSHSSARPHLRTIRFGMLDEPHGLVPQMAIWIDEAPAWAMIDPALEQWPRQPPPPPSPA